MEMSKSAATGMTNAIIQVSKNPEAESKISPRFKPMLFTNGVLKRHHAVVGGVAYKECLKNHAATLGGHALDGCGEFMPAPTATASDPISLRCAACGCHRNFHRREPDELCGGVGRTRMIEYHPHHRHHPLPPSAVAACRVESPGSDNNSPPPISSTYYPGSAPHMLLALSGGGDDTANKIELQQHQIFGTPPQMLSRKRHRTKFSQVQKEKMYEFAEKVGWKLLRSNEDLVNGFCNEIGVERVVFKVWMHNNKNTVGKRSATPASDPPPLNYDITANHQGGISIEDINDPIEEEDDDDQHDPVHGNGVVGNSHNNITNTNNTHHHHHHAQQYNNGRSAESINNAVPANASSSSS